jgi:hypothetical protein
MIGSAGWRAALVAVAVAAVMGGGAAAGTATAGGRATATGASCAPVLSAPARSPAYADTPWPTEHADVWRTHAAPTGLPANVRRLTLSTRSATLPDEPVWGYVGTGGKLYVIGGSPYLLNMFTQLMLGAPTSQIPALTARTLVASTRVTPYVAQIDARTMRVRVLRLTGGTALNYTGGLLVHANGFLYAVARAVLSKIDPRTFSIVARASLPLPPDASGQPNQKATYNGIVATPDGDLVLKGWASSGDAPGMLLRVDPDTLAVTASITSTAIASARMAIVDAGATQYVYFPGQSQSVRFVVSPTTFTLDDAWTTTYLDPSSGDTQASSDIYMGNGVLFANNTSPQATTPMREFSQGAAVGSPLASAPAFSGAQVGWNFFMTAGDPYRTGIAAVSDQATGRVAGFRACGGGVSFVKLWENDRIHSSAGMAVNDRAAHLYTDDRQCEGTTCRLFLVVLDLRTGRELARVRVKGTTPTMSQIFIGRNAVYYLATQTGDRHGYITRVTAGG